MGMSEQNQPEKKKNFQHHMAVPGKKGIIYTIARGIFWIYFHLFCFMHCTGREKLNLDAPYIVIANHTSFADPIIAAMLIRRYEVNFLGKIELAKAPVVGKLLMHLHMIPVDRHHSDMEAMRACLRVTKAGGVLGIFPEGTRNKEGTQDMAEFKTGTARFAIKTKVPVVPMIYYRSPKAFRKNWLYVGEPFTLEEFYGAKTPEENHKATELIREKMDETRRLCNEYVENNTRYGKKLKKAAEKEKKSK